METSAFEINIGYAFLMFFLLFIFGSLVVHFVLGLVNLICIRFDKKPINETLYVFFYLALHIYLFAILRPIVATSQKEWLLLLMVVLSFVLFIISKDIFANSTSYLFIRLFKLFKKRDIVKIGKETGEVRSINLLFTKLKIHPGKEHSITNKNILRQIIHNYSYDNLQRHTINFQLKNTDNFKEVTKGILLNISGYHSLTEAPKPCFYINQLNDKNTMATIYFWSSIANSSIIYNRIFDIIKTSISIHNKKPRFFNRDFEIIKN